MASVSESIYNLLAVGWDAETGWTPASPFETLAPGGVYDRMILRPPSKGATPLAFDAGGRPLVCIVVPDEGELVADDGPMDLSLDLQAMQAFPTVWFYGPTTATGKAAVRALSAAVYAALNGASVTGPGGSSIGLRASQRKGVADDPGLSGAVSDFIRFQADGIWS